MKVLKFILGQSIDYRTKISQIEDHNRRLQHELQEKSSKITLMEESIDSMRRSTSSENLDSEGRIKLMGEERDNLIEENSIKFEQNRALQVKKSRQPKVLSRALAGVYKVKFACFAVIPLDGF